MSLEWTLAWLAEQLVHDRPHCLIEDAGRHRLGHDGLWFYSRRPGIQSDLARLSSGVQGSIQGVWFRLVGLETKNEQTLIGLAEAFLALYPELGAVEGGASFLGFMQRQTIAQRAAIFYNQASPFCRPAASTTDGGEWPSGKAPVSGTGDRRFDPFLASQE